MIGQRKNLKYSGLLRKRIPRGLNDIEDAQAVRARVLELFAYFAIEPFQPQSLGRLVLALARAHVPGFRHRNVKVGTPKKWTQNVRAKLAIEVDLWMEKNPSRPARDAYRALARRKPWQGLCRAAEVARIATRLEDEASKGRQTKEYDRLRNPGLAALSDLFAPTEFHAPESLAHGTLLKALLEPVPQVAKTDGN